MLLTNNIDYKIDIQDRYCIFGGESGSGKTFMIKYIKAHCIATGIQCICIDYSLNKDGIIAAISSIKYDTSILVVDNAEIVLNKEIEDLIYQVPGYKIIMIRDTTVMPFLVFRGPGLYVINNEGGMLVTERIGQL